MKDCKQLTQKSNKSSNVKSGTKNSAHTIILMATRTRTAINSSRSLKISIERKYGTLIKRVDAARMTSAITRGKVNVALPLEVKVQKMRRSLWTAMRPAGIRVAATEK